MSNTLNVTGDVGETRRLNLTPHMPTGQEKSGPSRQDERTPANLGKLEKGIEPQSPPTGGMVIVDDADSPVLGDGTAGFEHDYLVGGLSSGALLASVSQLHEHSSEVTFAMLGEAVEGLEKQLELIKAIYAERKRAKDAVRGGAA